MYRRQDSESGVVGNERDDGAIVNVHMSRNGRLFVRRRVFKAALQRKIISFLYSKMVSNRESTSDKITFKSQEMRVYCTNHIAS